MNLKLIIYVSLLILILSSLLIFGYISYKVYSGNVKAEEFFVANNWLFYTNIGIEAIVLVLAGLLFIRR